MPIPRRTELSGEEPQPSLSLSLSLSLLLLLLLLHSTPILDTLFLQRHLSLYYALRSSPSSPSSLLILIMA